MVTPKATWSFWQWAWNECRLLFPVECTFELIYGNRLNVQITDLLLICLHSKPPLLPNGIKYLPPVKWPFWAVILTSGLAKNDMFEVLVLNSKVHHSTNVEHVYFHFRILWQSGGHPLCPSIFTCVLSVPPANQELFLIPQCLVLLLFSVFLSTSTWLKVLVRNRFECGVMCILLYIGLFQIKSKIPISTTSFLFFSCRERVVSHVSLQKLVVKNGGACRMKPTLYLVSSSDAVVQLGDFHRSLTSGLGFYACKFMLPST